MKKTLFIIFTFLVNLGHGIASDVLTVEDVTLPQNAEAIISIDCTFETSFKGFQIDIELDGGLTAVLNEDNKPIAEIGFSGTDHSVSASQVSEGKYRFVVVSLSNRLIPTSGTLLKVKVTGASDQNVGDVFNASVKAIEFTTSANEVQNFADIDFTITIGAPADTRTILNETSTVGPVDASNVDVRVVRTINANEWSTICLPFAMTAEQVTAAFGNDVQVADMTAWESVEDDDAVVGINVTFSPVAVIESNHPYIIKVSSPVSEFTVDGVDIEVDDEPMHRIGTKKANRATMYGTYVANTVIEEELLFLSGNQFWYSTGTTRMKAFRAYFEFADVLDAFYDSGAAKVGISIDDSETTGISSQPLTTSSRPSDMYNVTGQKVGKSYKGIVIVDGKKKVIKK